MTLPGTGPCHHCLRHGHWRDNCPLLVPAASRKEHEERIAVFTRRFTDEGLSLYEKRRMIETENQMWKKETARK